MVGREGKGRKAACASARTIIIIGGRALGA